MAAGDSLQNDFDRIFMMYEKAVEGRNQHYQNYNTWTNLYAIFTGALFVAYYNVYDSSSWLACLVAVLGYVTAICWLYSLSGYYAWIKSWISLVQEYETRLNDKFGTWFVYKYASARNLKDQQNGFPQNFSTQKITRVFITAVVIGWALMTVWNLFCLFCSYYNPDLSALRHCPNNDVINKIIKLLYAILGLLLTSGIWLVLHIHFISECRSTIKYMTTQIDKDNSEVKE